MSYPTLIRGGIAQACSGPDGWAQVRGARVESVADKTAPDLWYVRHASLGLDLKIVAATVPMILFAERVDKGAVRLAWDVRALGLRDRVGEHESRKRDVNRDAGLGVPRFAVPR